MRVYAVSSWTDVHLSSTARLISEIRTYASFGYSSSSGKHVPSEDGYRVLTYEAGEG